jgi:phosphoglycolate phosphatase-like HAD superfamily hydrolase
VDEAAAAVRKNVLVFDWGDTLMRVFPYEGAMVHWPEVAAVEGADEALQQIARGYRLFVATNAGDSSASQVEQALARVGLDRYFERVFTMHELGSRKPEVNFYLTLAEQIGLSPSECVMIGDDLQADVLGALQAGWRAVWLNPSNLPFPGLRPLHHGDIAHLSELPAAIDDLSLPDYSTCLTWLAKTGCSHSLLAHVHTVAALSYQMALWIRARGHMVHVLLAQRGGLLHDLAKAAALQSAKHQDHGEMASRMLKAYDQPALAEIAGRHTLFRPLQSGHSPETIEQKLVFFMDKLVEGSRVVTIEERIYHLRQRYSLDPERLEALMPHLYAIQDELCDLAGFGPEELAPRLQAAIQ